LIKLISFGFKSNGKPAQATRVFDCRNLRNPFSAPGLRAMTGKDEAVQRYVLADAQTSALLEAAELSAINGATLAFGCFGGKHRSVALAETLAKRLRAKGLEVEIEHRSLVAFAA
jgi:RNase adapter protein RapZ